MSLTLSDRVFCRLAFDGTCDALEAASDALEREVAVESHTAFPGIPFNAGDLL
jgi:hypothetical protein